MHIIQFFGDFELFANVHSGRDRVVLRGVDAAWNEENDVYPEGTGDWMAVWRLLGCHFRVVGCI